MTRPAAETARTFAELTAYFEDAASYAVQGQTQNLNEADARRLVRNIKHLLVQAEVALDQIL